MIERVTLMIMSGVNDGMVMVFRSDADGTVSNDQWLLTIGRKDDNDLVLRNDTFVSRRHAHLIWREEGWWLEDRDSTNGSFAENENDFFNDERIHGSIPIDINQLFRVGRTWMRIQVTD